MPINNYNTGRDVAPDVNLPNGPLRLANVTGFRSKQMYKKEESHGIDGINRFQYIPGGWEGEFVYDRANANGDTAIAFLEGVYFAGGNVLPGVITETIQEPDGGITVWRYTAVQFAMDDHGTWEGDKKVTQKIVWCASQRIQAQ